jgi:glycosyltransferase involved in cell wall biosynthesis
MRVCLFTDTLGDINGVSRFVRDVAQQALDAGRDLRVITSTRFDVPPRPNLLNFAPLLAMRMPKYENLELVLPPAPAILRYLRRDRPDVIHISTPGPVGCVGMAAARMLRVPVVGTYHTDFPAYIERLFDDPFLTSAAAGFMRMFYRPFRTIFSRSTDYAAALERLGIAPERIVRLRPGINTGTFSTSHRDEQVWERVRVPREGVKVLYCGRVSVEKNLPLLCTVWKQLRARLGAGEAQLVIIGDGPYRAEMQRELGEEGVHFLGFRHGQELSTLYASADLFVFPSITDTLGQVVMEAQSSALPVLVSDQGGPKEVVIPGRTGLVLESTRPAAWAKAVVTLVRDGDLRRRMGAAATEHIRPMTIRASFEHWWEMHELATRDGVTNAGLGADEHHPHASADDPGETDRERGALTRA